MPDAARILLVDDNPNEGFLLEDALLSVGWSVLITHYHKLSDVIAQLQNQSGEDGFDLVLIDYNLPGSSLEQAIAQMRELSITRSAPIMILSVISRDYDRDRLMRSGVKEILVKPASVSDYAKFAADISPYVTRNRQQEPPIQGSTAVPLNRSTSVNHRPAS